MMEGEWRDQIAVLLNCKLLSNVVNYCLNKANKNLVWWWWCFPTPSVGWGAGAQKNSTKTQQMGHAARSGPEVKSRKK